MKTPIILAACVSSLALITHISAEGEGEKTKAKEGIQPHHVAVNQESMQPFLKQYCYKCHGPKKQKGDVRFDKINWVMKDNDSAQRWQDVLDQLNAGEMPPWDEDEQPTNEEMKGVLERLTGNVHEARRRLTDHGGEIKMRRLNKREYSNTIRDLFGFDVHHSDIPDDGEIASFDTVGAEQFFTSAHLEKYLQLGNKIATTALKYNTSPHRKSRVARTQPEKRVTQKMRDDLADKDRKMAMKKAGKNWQEMGFKDEGDMKILFRQWDSRAEAPRQYLSYPHIENGVYISDVAKWVTASQHVDYRAEYIVRVHGGVVGNPHPLRRIIKLWSDSHHGAVHGTLKLAGTPEKPQTVSLRVSQPMGQLMLVAKVRENTPSNAFNTMRHYLNKLKAPGKHPDQRAAVWIDWLEIEGPFYPKLRPKLETLLYPNKSTGGQNRYINRDATAREFIEKFTTIAFRQKKPAADFIDGLHTNFKQSRASGIKYKEAMAEVMSIILSSPGFLFIQEAVPAQDKPHGLLSNRELAIRLSYFLWSSPPDDALFAANLTDPKIYEQQVERLLADPRSDAFRDGFIDQWTELERYDAITVDVAKHHHFNQGLREDAKQEVREYFGVLLKENLPVAKLIDSDFAVINGTLAAHYNIPGVNQKDQSFQKIKLPPSSPRGGLFTTTAFLTTGSNGERSSPVIRGALILEKVLHDKPPPPPPNVPELDEASDKPMSNRAMVLLHQKRATCASCHSKMDVIGFGFENFNSIGRWRTTEKIGKKNLLIQPGGTLPGNQKFNNINELKKLLLKHEDKLAEELVESVLNYALGRTVEFSDADDVEEILNKLKTGKYRTKDLVKEIALSPLFKKK